MAHGSYAGERYLSYTTQPDQTPWQLAAGGPIHTATLLAGSLDGTVALLRVGTGRAIWRTSSHREVGTLAHDGTRVYVALGSPLHLLRGSWRESREQHRRREERLQAEPARLEARDARDGHRLWRRADWRLIGRLDVGVDAAAAMVAISSTSIYGDRALYGLDAHTGATRWTYPTTGDYRIDDHRFALRGGRIYCYGEGARGGVLVLDARSGQALWERNAESALVFSPRGGVVVEQRWSSGSELSVVRVLDPATGAVRQELALRGGVRAASDENIAYMSTSTFDSPGLAAVRLEDGRELWRADTVLAYQLAVTETTVYCGRLLVPPYVGEVEALDAHSGQTRWRWRTPSDLRELLRLWGLRTPRIAAASALLAGKAIAETLEQPDVGNALRREFADGQWRHPYRLRGAVNAMWLVADRDTAYLGTWLGVFALRAGDGRLRWHAMQTTDLSFLLPALRPE